MTLFHTVELLTSFVLHYRWITSNISSKELRESSEWMEFQCY